MKLFGFELTARRAKAAPTGALAPVVPAGGQSSFMGFIAESFAGAWQRGIVKANRTDLLANSAVYSCVTLIASHISMLCPKLMEETGDGICVEVDRASPYWAVLREPNHFQTIVKLVEQWMVSKLLYGNAYALKVRDARGIVVQLYLLHPERCRPLVAPTGDVFYALSSDNLSGVEDQVSVPASEIIHDMMVSLWHPLVGVSPITACATSGGLGNKITENSERFFANYSRPSGLLYHPGQINDQLAAELKKKWDDNYSGENVGRTAVLAGGLKYEPMGIPATDAQLIEQLRWTIEDVARCFHIPLFMLGAGPIPATSNAEFLARLYYTQTLQPLIEQMESSLDRGLGLRAAGYEVELDTEGLLRMDTPARFDAYQKAIAAGWMAPNEARAREGYAPVEGGDTPYMQQQNWSLAQLNQRTGPNDAPGAPTPAAPPAPGQAAMPAYSAPRAAPVASVPTNNERILVAEVDRLRRERDSLEARLRSADDAADRWRRGAMLQAEEASIERLRRKRDEVLSTPRPVIRVDLDGQSE
ncbi:MAG: phage portal protein [Burkholderiaceae bacterium]